MYSYSNIPKYTYNDKAPIPTTDNIWPDKQRKCGNEQNSYWGPSY
jgi:hypothetical protein